MFLIPLIKTLRPYQWYKNLLLFAGLVFSYNLTDTAAYPPVLLGFALFCLMSGSVYILNDVIDRKEDGEHPVKRKRPIASGRLDVRIAVLFMLLFVLGCPVLAYFRISSVFAVVLVIYFLLFVVYSLILKYLVIIDTFTIGTGFVLRAIAGVSAVEGAQLSWWLIICTFLLALFLAFGKRRAEMKEMGRKKAGNYRSVYSVYTIKMLDHLTTLTAGATIVIYCLYSASAPHEGMVLTIPFVVFGMLKYIQLMHSEDMGAEPEKMFEDPYMTGAILLWFTAVFLILYGKVGVVMDLISFSLFP